MDGLPRRQTTNLCASNHDPPGWTMTRNQTVCFWGLHRYLDGPFDGAPHGKRILCQRPQRQDRFAFRSRRPARAALRRAAFRPSPRSSSCTAGCPCIAPWSFRGPSPPESRGPSDDGQWTDTRHRGLTKGCRIAKSDLPKISPRKPRDIWEYPRGNFLATASGTATRRSSTLVAMPGTP
jgi:hypothetical protein